MTEVRQTEVFTAWLVGLRDRQAGARILARIRRLSEGNPGEVKPVGGGVSEMRIDYGPGYRLYFVGRGKTVVILLCGGDKRSQDRDIVQAIGMAQKVWICPSKRPDGILPTTWKPKRTLLPISMPCSKIAIPNCSR